MDVPRPSISMPCNGVQSCSCTMNLYYINPLSNFLHWLSEAPFPEILNLDAFKNWKYPKHKCHLTLWDAVKLCKISKVMWYWACLQTFLVVLYLIAKRLVVNKLFLFSQQACIGLLNIKGIITSKNIFNATKRSWPCWNFF